jgi:hypothetical protein
VVIHFTHIQRPHVEPKNTHPETPILPLQRGKMPDFWNTIASFCVLISIDQNRHLTCSNEPRMMSTLLAHIQRVHPRWRNNLSSTYGHFLAHIDRTMAFSGHIPRPEEKECHGAIVEPTVRFRFLLFCASTQIVQASTRIHNAWSGLPVYTVRRIFSSKCGTEKKKSWSVRGQDGRNNCRLHRQQQIWRHF